MKLKTLLTFLVGLVGLITALYGLLVINYPSGGVLGHTAEEIELAGLKDFFLAGLILLLIGMVHLGAFFSLVQSAPQQYSWSIASGIFLVVSMVIGIFVTASHYWMQAILAGAGIMNVLLSLQVKGKWVV